jgi:cytochrome c oxidase subunit 2
MARITVACGVVAIGLAIAVGTLWGQSDRRVITVNAERFAFTPSRIEIAPGEEVELRLKSADTSHGFRVLGTETNVAIPKRGKGEVSVVIRLQAPGTYTFECSRMCGAGHHFMRGEIVVKPATGSALNLPQSPWPVAGVPGRAALAKEK